MTALGPIGRSVGDLKLILENSFGHSHKYDSYCMNSSFNQKLYNDTVNNKRLKIAYLLEDEFSGCSIPIKNTINEVVEFLKL